MPERADTSEVIGLIIVAPLLYSTINLSAMTPWAGRDSPGGARRGQAVKPQSGGARAPEFAAETFGAECAVEKLSSLEGESPSGLAKTPEFGTKELNGKV